MFQLTMEEVELVKSQIVTSPNSNIGEVANCDRKTKEELFYMVEEEKNQIELVENIESLVYTIRGVQVMLDTDLARIYGYEVKALNQQVKRNIERFPEDFMFQLTENEVVVLRSQNVTANISSKSRALPYVFTE